MATPTLKRGFSDSSHRGIQNRFTSPHAVAPVLPSNSPMGFVAILGVLALIGILIRNSVILIVQIELERATTMAFSPGFMLDAK